MFRPKMNLKIKIFVFFFISGYFRKKLFGSRPRSCCGLSTRSSAATAGPAPAPQARSNPPHDPDQDGDTDVEGDEVDAAVDGSKVLAQPVNTR